MQGKNNHKMVACLNIMFIVYQNREINMPYKAYIPDLMNVAFTGGLMLWLSSKLLQRDVTTQVTVDTPYTNDLLNGIRRARLLAHFNPNRTATLTCTTRHETHVVRADEPWQTAFERIISTPSHP
jgi:hypothetical protein